MNRAILLAIIFLGFLVITANSSIARAQTYEVNSLSDFREAVMHATDGDTIIFKTMIDFSYLDDFRYFNDNNNGQFFNARIWQISGITLVIQGQGQNVGIKNGEIALLDADGSVITDLVFNKSRISVIGDSDEVTIADNVFHEGVIYIDTGSDNYVIQNNNFWGDGGLSIYDTMGTIEGAVSENFINGLPILYLQGSSCSAGGQVYGEVVAVNCESVSINGLDLTQATGLLPSRYMIISKVGEATVSNLVTNGVHIEIDVYRSSNIVISDSRLLNTTFDVRQTNGFALRNSEIEYVNPDPEYIDYFIYVAEDSGNVTIQGSNISLYASKLLEMWEGSGVIIENNSIDFEGNTSIIELTNVSHIRVSGNTVHVQALSYYRPYIAEIVANNGDHRNVMVKNNVFEAEPTYKYGSPYRYISGVYITGITNVHVANNTLKWLIWGVSLFSVHNAVVEDNDFDTNYVSIAIGDVNNITVKRNTVGNKSRFIYLTDVLNGVEIYGNFIDMKDHSYATIDFESVNNPDVHIYMNAFLNLPDVSLLSVTDTEGLTNNTFSSGEPITYSYNGREYTCIVGNYYDTYTGQDSNDDGIGDQPFALSYGYKYSDEHPLVSINIVNDWLGIGQQPQPGHGEHEEEGGHPEEITGSIPVPLTPERRSLIEEARDADQALRNIIAEMLEKRSGLLKETETVRHLLNETGIDELMQELRDNGLIDRIIELPPSGALQLRQTLEELYGPLLINYPDPMGRLYLLYTLYYLQ